MIPIDDSYVDAAAPNAAAIKNGRDTLRQGKLAGLFRDADDTLLFGECRGSGKDSYRCSADFARPDAPVYRCSCPSRQFPCKHTLALLYAYAAGRPFAVAEVPAEVASKREKAQVRAEKKVERANQPVKVNRTALAKKVQVQLDALDLLENLVHDLARAGLANLDARSARRIEEQGRKLKDAYIPGAQMALQDLTRLFYREGRYLQDEEVGGAAREASYSEALDRLGRLQSLCKRGREALAARLEREDLQQETGSSIAAWLGHAWQLRELRDAGLVERDVELIQLAFTSYDDPARQELVDTGTWVDLGSGAVHLTRTYRPYQAAKFIKSEDSVFHVVQVPELCVYPGEMNRRVRWDQMTPRAVTPADHARLVALARPALGPLIKEVKAQLKAPLADRTPLALVRFARLGRVGPEYVLEDAARERIVLADDGAFEEPDTCHLLPLVPPALLRDGALLGRFHHDLDRRTLRLKPLSLVGETQVLRLSF